MATATATAAFAQLNKTGLAVNTLACVIGTADAPTNTALLFKAGAFNGAIVTRIVSIPRGSITATAMYLFLSKDGDVTKRLIDSELIGAYTLAATTAIPETQFTNYSETAPLHLDAGDELYIGASVALAAGIVTRLEAIDC